MTIIPNPDSMSLPRLTPKLLLARVNHELVTLRRALHHRHDDTEYWSALGITPEYAQYRQYVLRPLAHRLHVERATQRNRIHARQYFGRVADQRAWLANAERIQLGQAALWFGLPVTTTLADLRAS